MQVEVTGLFIYPVKSFKGIALQKAELTNQGITLDRRWLVINAKGGFITQRQLPQMACVHTRLTDTTLVLSCNGMDDLEIPFDYTGPGSRIEAKVWRDTCETLDEGDTAAEWLQTAIGWNKPVRLVRMAPAFNRPQSAPELLGEKTSTHFADAAPFLVANEGSLAALNDTLKSNGLKTVPMNRFRPNIVIRGLDAFNEHQMKTLGNGNYQLQFCYPCERCIMTTIDQQTGIKHPDMEPFKTLATLNGMPEKPQAPAFAENAILSRGTGQTIRLGDLLDIS